MWLLNLNGDLPKPCVPLCRMCSVLDVQTLTMNSITRCQAVYATRIGAEIPAPPAVLPLSELQAAVDYLRDAQP